jgi:hypothetical protein
MNMATTADASGRLNAKPPVVTWLPHLAASARKRFFGDGEHTARAESAVIEEIGAGLDGVCDKEDKVCHELTGSLLLRRRTSTKNGLAGHNGLTNTA